MQVLTFRHVPFEDLGRIASALHGRGIQPVYADLYQNSKAPVDEARAGGLIFMGGPMSANDDFDYLRRELGIIERAVASGKPVLGVCLGAQLIAKAMGCRVYRNPVKEIGWKPVYWTEAASSDPLFAGLGEPETVLHWHGETFDLPRDAEWLAWSEDCRNQAFRIGQNVWGLQFHLEVTPAMVAGWCLEDANCGDVRELEAPIDPAANCSRLEELAALVFGRWADVLVSGSTR